MLDLDWPGSYGQENDPHCPADPPEPKRRRSGVLKLSDDETRNVRVAIRKLARAFGGYVRLSAMTGIPANTLRRAVRPGCVGPTGTLAIRLASAAKVPVEVLLVGKLVVASAKIGVAA